MQSIAEQKRKENIAEYLLYMWQVEDTIRACDFDLDTIKRTILSSIKEESERENSEKWYGDLITKMKREGITASGHLEELNELMREVVFLQHILINGIKDARFQALYREAGKVIEDLKKRSAIVAQNDVEIALNVLYGVLLLRIQQKPVSDETNEAVTVLSQYMAYLAASFKKMRDGKINFPLN